MRKIRVCKLPLLLPFNNARSFIYTPKQGLGLGAREIENSLFSTFITFASMNKTRLADIGLLIIIGLVMVIIVNPIGNFPLDDDFMYSRPVSFLVNKGFYYSDILFFFTSHI